MAESADAEDLKSSNPEGLCGFKSRSRHQFFRNPQKVLDGGFYFLLRDNDESGFSVFEAPVGRQAGFLRAKEPTIQGASKGTVPY